MYLQHFGMREMPFSITPDTSFFYAYGSYVDALNTLLVAVRSGDGFIMVTGEVGTGKTLLCRKFINSMRGGFVTAYIHNPYLQPHALLLAVADELRIPYEDKHDQHQLLKQLTRALVDSYAEGKRVVLCLDEVQAMPVETLEMLRLLTNLETEKRKLLQVVLFGQPELHEVLERPSVRQLKQRIVFSYQLQPIDKDGMEGYVAHRLLVAGYTGKRLFAPLALKDVYHAARGIPRLINILCHKALMAAYGRGERCVERYHVRVAIRDTLDEPLKNKDWLNKALFGGIAVALVVAFSGALYHYWPLLR